MLEHSRYTNKQGATINAFQHFTYPESKKTPVLANIQCLFSTRTANDLRRTFKSLFSQSLTRAARSPSGRALQRRVPSDFEKITVTLIMFFLCLLPSIQKLWLLVFVITHIRSRTQSLDL
jgi:hypothetical protein